MKQNIGQIDKIVRLIFAAVLSVLYFTGLVSGTYGILVLILSLIVFLTSLISVCLLYFPFGINTKSKKDKK